MEIMIVLPDLMQQIFNLMFGHHLVVRALILDAVLLFRRNGTRGIWASAE